MTKPFYGMLEYTLRHPIMGLNGSEVNATFQKEDIAFSSFVAHGCDTNIPALRGETGSATSNHLPYVP
eukprot:scaffold9694_cov28-Attheya_sp.AAC.4